MENTRLIDVREHMEYAAQHIHGSELVPLRHIRKASQGWDRDTPITLVCRSGKRAELARRELAAHGFTQLSVLEGGILRWAAEGKPVHRLARVPWSMERQVRVTAGSLILITMSLAALLSPWFLAGTAFVGAGLVFAGVSDICMMASVLGAMPWNRPSSRAVSEPAQ